MEIKKREQKKEKFVRILIGNAETGNSNLTAPTKSISVRDSNVEEVYDTVYDALAKKGIKS